MTAGLGAADYGILAAYLAFVVGLGIWVGRGQRSTEEYFLAGRRMHWFPVGLSIMATLFSAISYLGYPAEIYQYGMRQAGLLLTFVLVTPLIILGFMPFYHRLRLTTAYEYLERRFDVRVRSAASLLFVLTRVGWMAAVIYTPSMALCAVTGWPLPVVVLGCGLLATLYTILGGMKAVIWTDVAQFCIFVGGLAGALYILHRNLNGGLDGAFYLAKLHDRVNPGSFRHGLEFDWSLVTRMTAWGCWIGALFTMTADYGVDQVSIQRYLTNRDLEAMQKSFVLNMAGVLVVVGGLMALGTGLWIYYQQHPDPRVGELTNDAVFPHFILTHFPPGFVGLMLAALLAATMSSVDSGLNSVATALTVDFWERFGWVGGDEAARLRLARGLTLLLGLVVTVLALFVGNLGTIIEITSKVNSGFKGPLLGIFLLGMLTRRARGTAVLAGAAVGLAVAMYTTYGWPLETRPSFMWLTVIGFVPTVLIGGLTSLLWKPPVERAC